MECGGVGEEGWGWGGGPHGHWRHLPALLQVHPAHSQKQEQISHPRLCCLNKILFVL